MSKRFTDTSIWCKEWYMKLSPSEKCAFNYIKDNCDSVGVWSVNKLLAEMQIGEQINWSKLIDNSKGNIRIINDGKWWLIDFCDFQYGELDENSNSKPIQSYIKLLKKHDLWLEYIEYAKGMVALKEKEQEKEQEEEKEKEYYSKTKKYYNTLLIDIYKTQEKVNDLLFNSNKQRQQHANLIKKIFNDELDFKIFFDEAFNDKWIKDQGLLPSILISQYDKIKAKVIIKKNIQDNPNLEVVT
jgi:hypothetical protein